MRSRRDEKESVECLGIIPRRGNQYWKRTWRKPEPEPAQFLLLEQGIESEGLAKPGKEVARAEGLDAIHRTTKSVGRDRNQLR